MTKSIVLRAGKAFVNVNGEMMQTSDPTLIGNAVLDMLEKTKETNYNDLRTVFANYLKEKNHRNTPERFAILEHICTVKAEPFNAKLIHKRMMGAFRVSIGTIYNTFSMLVDANIIELSAKEDQQTLKGVFKTTYFEMKGSNLKMTA